MFFLFSCRDNGDYIGSLTAVYLSSILFLFCSKSSFYFFFWISSITKNTSYSHFIMSFPAQTFHITISTLRIPSMYMAYPIALQKLLWMKLCFRGSVNTSQRFC